MSEDCVPLSCLGKRLYPDLPTANKMARRKPEQPEQETCLD